MTNPRRRQPDFPDDTFEAPPTLRRSIPALQELRQAGRALRQNVPLDDIGRWESSPHRVDPNDLIAATNAHRIPKLVKYRNKKMAESVYAFFRGSAEVMLADLKTLPTTGIRHPICGDAHLGNFGPYELSEGRTVFDLNDFDQAGIGSWEWDVARLCTSVVLAARALKEASSQPEQDIAAQAAGTYRRVLTQAANCSVVERIDRAVFDTRASAEAAGLSWPVVQKSLAWQDPTVAGGPSSPINRTGKHQARFDYSDELEDVKGAQARVIYAGLDRYLPSLPLGRSGLFARYEAVDVARGQAGIGSLGIRDYRVLLQGSDDDDLLELQIKQARPATQRPALKPVDADAGRSIILCQRALQAFIDPLLGWTRFDRRRFYVRKRRATPGSFKPEEVSAKELAERGELCAAALAYAHARCGNPELVAAYLGTSDRFDRAMAAFGAAYANQVEHDYARFHKKYG